MQTYAFYIVIFSATYKIFSFTVWKHKKSMSIFSFMLHLRNMTPLGPYICLRKKNLNSIKLNLKIVENGV